MIVSSLFDRDRVVNAANGRALAAGARPETLVARLRSSQHSHRGKCVRTSMLVLAVATGERREPSSAARSAASLSI